jgi:hypothetical protein
MLDKPLFTASRHITTVSDNSSSAPFCKVLSYIQLLKTITSAETTRTSIDHAFYAAAVRYHTAFAYVTAAADDTAAVLYVAAAAAVVHCKVCALYMIAVCRYLHKPCL